MLPAGDTTTIRPGVILIDTANYSVDFGHFGTRNTDVGLGIYSAPYHPYARVLLTPENLSLIDNSGKLRVSIGRTSLVRPGNSSGQITSESSIITTDKTGHVLWQAPQ
jgi:hypothetical protein